MIKEQLKTDMKEAMKRGDSFATGVIRLALASLSQREKEKRYKALKENSELTEETAVQVSQLTDEEVIDVLAAEVKKRRDAIALYEQGGRSELADNEKAEIEVLKKYLPEQLSLEDIQAIIKNAIQSTGATSMKEMGKVMAEINPKIKGRADGSEVSKMVKEILS